MARVGLLMLSVSFIHRAAEARDLYVDQANGSDDYDGLTAQTAKRTIQAAVDIAKSRDTVKVAEGVYEDENTHADGTLACVVISNNLTLVAAGAKEKTHIVGRHADTATGVGEGAVRCIYVKSDSKKTVRIQGFTIRDGATVSGNGGGVAFAVYDSEKNIERGWLVDCVVSNCVAVRGGALLYGTAIRCLFSGNASGGADKPYGTVASQSILYNCLAVENVGGDRLFNYPRAIVNCTIAGNNMNNFCYSSGAHYIYNTIFLENAEKKFHGSNAVLSNCLVSSGISDFNRTASGMCATNDSGHCFFAPATGDWRPVAESGASGLGDASHLASVNLPEESLRYVDYAGNPISEDRPMDAGAIQGGVKIEGGRLDFLTGGFHRHEGDVPCRYGSYAYAEKWPSVLVCSRTAPDGKRTFGCRVSGSYVSPACSYRFPNLEERFSFAFPPKGINSEITAYAVQRTYYVDDDGNDENDGSAPDKAFKTFQKAADSIKANGGSCNLVSVAAGAYNEGGGFNKGLENRLHVAGISVQFYAPEGPDVTFIEGAPDPKSEFHGLGPGATRCLYWFSSHREAAMRGFTFRNGHTSHTDGDKWDSADANQGGVAFISVESDGKVQFLDCVFSNNTALISAVNTGGDFTRCRFVNNRAINSQGSIGRNSTYRFCSFHGNGPGVYTLDNSVQNIYFCTLEGRTTPYQSNIYGSVIVNPGVASETIEKNTDFDGNVVSPGCTVKRKEGTEGELNYLSADPMLADLASGDMHLLAGSPALGAANVANITTLLHQVTVDMDGNAPNFIGGNMTAGAYQWPSMSVTVSGREGALEIQGGKLGSNALRPGATISVTAAERVNGRRFEGFVVNGEQMSPAERMFTYTVPQMPTEAMTIETIYGNLGTIMVVR